MKQYHLVNRTEDLERKSNDGKAVSDLQDDSKNIGGNISMDQLKQLMKNPQIAQFLKEQIEI